MKPRNLPKQVQAQLDAANAIEAGMQQHQADQPAEVVQDPQPVEPVEQPAVEQQQPQADEGLWEQRYKSLQGQFNSTMPRLQQEVAAKRDEVASLTTRLSELERKLAEASEKPDKPSAVTDQDREMYGDDVIEMTRRVAAQEAAENAKATYLPIISELQAQMAEMQRQFGQVSDSVAENATEKFYSTLTTLVPDWVNVNENIDFLRWLGEIDPMYGEQRQAALDRACASLDVNRAAAVFNVWKSQFAPVLPTPAPTPANNELAQHAAPRTSQVAQHVQPKPEKVYTGREIAEFYDNKRKGRYTHDEAVQLENAINDALSKGRVVP